MYYHHVSRHVVTEANLHIPELLHKINYWMGEFDNALDRASFKLPDAYELLLELDMEEQGCSYYLVDHNRHMVFYLDDTNTEQLDLPDVCSMDHLSMRPILELEIFSFSPLQNSNWKNNTGYTWNFSRCMVHCLKPLKQQ